MAGFRGKSRSWKILAPIAIVSVMVPMVAWLDGDSETTLGAATTPTFSAGSVSVVEGDTGIRLAYLPVTLSDPPAGQVGVTYTVSAGTATAAVDFKTRTGRLLFKPALSGINRVRRFVTVPITGDTSGEPAETFTLTLSNVTAGALIGHPVGTGTILDDDPGTGVRAGVGDAAIYEGDSGGTRPAVITVTLSNPATSDVTVGYRLTAGTATAVSDFKTRTGTMTFKLDQWKKTIVAVVVSETVTEANETVAITLTSISSGATISRANGTLTILDDDSGPGPGGPTTSVAAAGDLGGSDSQLQPVADQIVGLDPDVVFALGDIVYPDGQASGFNGFFDRTWGRFRSNIVAAPGNHDYHTANASGFFGYFPQPEYFANDVGPNGWRVYVINCEINCDAGSAQASFVAADVAANPNRHRFAIVHRPRFTSGASHGDYAPLTAIWDTLAANGGEFMLAGHNHLYERFARMTGSGTVSSSGMRQFVVGTGGNQLYGFNALHVGEEDRDNTHFGVLTMELGATSYSWKFIGTNGDEVDAGVQATK